MPLDPRGSVKERTRSSVREPKMYNVVMLNDDFTTMDFVVEILIDIFHKDEVTAETLMMKVHREGSAIVGRYTYDIAVTKVNEALSRARTKGFPFQMRIEEA